VSDFSLKKWKSRIKETLIIDTELETDYPKSSDQPPSYSQSDCSYKITSDPQVTYIVSTGHDDSKNNGTLITRIIRQHS
jgi:hypothetical protein